MGLDAVEKLSDEEDPPKTPSTPNPKSTAKKDKKTKPDSKPAAKPTPTKTEKNQPRSAKSTKETAKAKANMKRPAASNAATTGQRDEQAAKKRPAASDVFKVYKCKYKDGKYGFKWDGHEQMRVTCFMCSYVRISFMLLALNFS